MKLVKTSASEVKDFQACNRLWFFRYILGRRTPQTEPQARGTVVHGALEAYLKAGIIEPKIAADAAKLGITVTDLNEYVEAIKPFVGVPGEGATEFKDEMLTWEGGPAFVFVVDHARQVEIPPHGILPQIDDLKTTSDFRYCKTPEELAKDPQMIAYAKWALTLYEEQKANPPNFVNLRHVYVRTRNKRKATCREVLVTPKTIEEEWERILSLVREMVALADREPKVMEVTPTTTSCMNYGGCAFRIDCHGPDFEKTLNPIAGLFTMEKKIMADTSATPTSTSSRGRLADRVAALKAGAPTVPGVGDVPAAPPAPPCGGTSQFVPGVTCTLQPHRGCHESVSVDGGVVHWSDRMIGFGPSPDKELLTAAEITTVAAVKAAMAPGTIVRVPGVNGAPAMLLSTPAAAPVAAAPAAVAPASQTAPWASQGAMAALVAAQAASKAPGGLTALPVASVAPATSPAPQTAPTTSPAAPTTPQAVTVVGSQVLSPDAASRVSTPAEVEAANTPKKRGKKAAAAAEGAAVAAAVTGAPGVPVELDAPVPGATLPTSAPAALPCHLVELYVDAWPVRGALEQPGLGEDIVAAAGRIVLDELKTDYRMISYTSRGILATAIRSLLPTVPKVLVVTSSSQGSDVLLEVLTPYAQRVVRALRG